MEFTDSARLVVIWPQRFPSSKHIVPNLSWVCHLAIVQLLGCLNEYLQDAASASFQCMHTIFSPMIYDEASSSPFDLQHLWLVVVALCDLLIEFAFQN